MKGDAKAIEAVLLSFGVAQTLPPLILPHPRSK